MRTGVAVTALISSVTTNVVTIRASQTVRTRLPMRRPATGAAISIAIWPLASWAGSSPIHARCLRPMAKTTRPTCAVATSRPASTSTPPAIPRRIRTRDIVSTTRHQTALRPPMVAPRRRTVAVALTRRRRLRTWVPPTQRRLPRMQEQTSKGQRIAAAPPAAACSRHLRRPVPAGGWSSRGPRRPPSGDSTP